MPELVSTPLAVAPATGTADPDSNRSFQRDHLERELPATWVAALRAVADRQHLAWPVLLAGLWAVLLHRYSGETQVVFGLAINGHVRGVQLALPEELSCNQWLAALAAPVLNSDTERSTLETLLSCENESRSRRLGCHGPQWRLQLLAPWPEPFAIRLVGKRRWRLVAEYDPHRFSAATVARVLEHLQNLGTGLGQDPQRAVADLPLLSAAERRQLLVDWNSERADYPVATTYPELFAAQVRRRPQAVAVCHGMAQLTYAELEDHARRLAAALVQHGVGPDQPVGVCLERSLEWPVTLLGILHSGGAYLPLDPVYPPEHLRAMLADASASVVVTRRVHLKVLAGCPATLLCLDDWPSPANAANAPPAPLSGPASPGNAPGERLAYLMYTSGSTGPPKGVAIPHRALLNHNHAVIEAYGLGPEDRVLQFASLNFDLSVEEMFPSWLAGATVVLRPADLLGSVEQFWRFIATARVTVLNLPTAYWHELCQQLASHSVPACVRLVVIGGELASPTAYGRWQTTGVPLINTYGPTETTVSATLFHGGPGSELPIGRPLPNVEVYVLDQRQRPVPIGVSGELHIGGTGLARGYWQAPELTAQKFPPHPFRPGARLYRTGDLVRWRADANLEFVGRSDTQVNWRGYRVETRTGTQRADRLRGATSPQFRSTLVALQPQGPRAPLYLVHDIGGGLFWGYGNIARHLGPEQPVHVFQSRGLDGGEEPGSIEEMARQYLQDLRAFQPAGP
jgi:amino acid adenylation domain-containing protein